MAAAENTFQDSSAGNRSTPTVCPRCQKEIPSDAPMGLCPACLWIEALEPPKESQFVGDYELLGKIGRGGMGVVYQARQEGTARLVALKMILNGELASEAEVYRFRGEVELAMSLEHPNIVPVYYVGEDDGRHYYTMKYMEGGSLADHIERYRQEPRAAAKLVRTIALAVAYGHDRGILHRDLKPANILLDGDGNPYVADFGLAKHMDKKSSYSHSGMVLGAPSYMAPEQADPRGKILTTAADVYSLGVTLFEMVTGRCPFEGADAGEIIEKVLHRAAPDPRTIDPRIDLDLATLCLRCLEKDPANRYQSAKELAQEIERYLQGEPIAKVGRLQRVWRWSKRRPLMAALVVEFVLLLVVATLAVFSGAAAQEKDRREEVLRANEYAARWVAGTVLFKLNIYHDIVAKVAMDFPPELFASLREKDVRLYAGMEQYCHSVFDRYRMPDGRARFDGFFIRDANGRARARWPAPAPSVNYRGRDDSWMDYFKGAMQRAQARSRAAYVGRVKLSETTNMQGFAIVAPIYGENDEPLGMIGAVIETGATLGTLELNDPSDNRHIAMVVGPHDKDREARDEPLPQNHVILVHDSLAVGRTFILRSNPAVHEAVALADKSNPHRGLEQLLLPKWVSIRIS